MCRLLVEDTVKHHALHLDTIRRTCSKDPAAFLTAFYNALNQPTRNKQQVIKVAKSNEDKEEEPIVAFDGLEEVETREHRRLNSTREGGSAVTGLFTSILGSKESRFRTAN
jgi:hypothetical protein